jgi:very-short-patch-repair endonuclease
MRGQTNRNILRPALQRRLRKASTDAERALWRHLRGKQLNGCKFRRQHPYFDYILDFVCIERRLVIELDGGQHLERVDADRARDARLAADGYGVLRFWNDAVLTHMHDVLGAIWCALQDQQHEQHHPHPGPPLEGEGEPQQQPQHHPHPGPPLEGEGAQRDAAPAATHKEPTIPC